MMEDKQLCIVVEGCNQSDEKLKSIIEKNADVLYDLTKNVDLKKMLSEINEGKKVIICNLYNSKPEVSKFIKDNNIRTKYFETTNHKEKCYELMIPFTKYSSIEEETNGKVKDLHIGEGGHRELTKTLISLIEKSLNKPSPRKIMNVPNNYPKEKQRFI